MMDKLRNGPLLPCFGFTIAACLIVILLRVLGGLQLLELHAYDFLMHWRLAQPIDSRIVLIGETERDIQRFGYPFSDAVLSDSLERLIASGARVVGVDRYRDVPVSPGTERLTKTLRQNGNIVWIFFVASKGRDSVPPPAVLKGSEQIGFNDVISDQDGITRRGLLFLGDGQSTYYSFPLVLALKYLEKERIYAESGESGFLRLGKTTIKPLDATSGGYHGLDAGGYQMLLDYPGLPNGFPSYTVSDLIDGKIPAGALRDKVVLLGSMAPSLADYHMFPSAGRHFGVELHAYVVAQLLDIALDKRVPIRAWGDGGELAVLALYCFAGSAIGYRRSGKRRFSIAVAMGLVSICAATYVLFQMGWWLPMASPVIGWLASIGLSVIYFSIQEKAERKQLMQILDAYVSPKVATLLWEGREHFFLNGAVKPEKLTATVLFTDLVGFTSVAETMEPLALMSWLNRYLMEMSRIVTDGGGMVNKYIGDSIMAVFGAPIKRSLSAEIAGDAIMAVECALRMGERLEELNDAWRKAGSPTMTMRVGIHTGPLIAGSLGGRDRVEYTVVGDTVNIASRLESFDGAVAPPSVKQPCRILIGPVTYIHVKDFFTITPIGEYSLKGRACASMVYQVLGRGGPG